jgi:formylglycine-generating enzyme required for sulfatase activity
MVVIPAGHFMMGSTEAEGERELVTVPEDSGFSPLDFLVELVIGTPQSFAKTVMAREKPLHPVTISRPFALGVFPVTKDEFTAFVHATGYSVGKKCYSDPGIDGKPQLVTWQMPGFSQSGRDPVVCIGWNDAKAYVRWLNQKVAEPAAAAGDGPYRLPSESEWEYAARAGTKTARWWGDSIGIAMANCSNCGNRPGYAGRTTPVGLFPPNPFGLYDMLGNVLEFLADCKHDNYVGAPADESPWTEARCDVAAARGGSWSHDSWTVRAAARFGITNPFNTYGVGFRVAKTLP